MRTRSYDEWQGYDPDFDPPSYSGSAETLPLTNNPRIKIVSSQRYRARVRRPKIVRGFQ